MICPTSFAYLCSQYHSLIKHPFKIVLSSAFLRGAPGSLHPKQFFVVITLRMCTEFFIFISIQKTCTVSNFGQIGNASKSLAIISLALLGYGCLKLGFLSRSTGFCNNVPTRACSPFDMLPCGLEKKFNLSEPSVPTPDVKQGSMTV